MSTLTDHFRIVNGVRLSPVFTWIYGDYLICTDSIRAAETGVGYFTVSHVERNGTISGPWELRLIDRVLSLADAVTLAQWHAAQRTVKVGDLRN